MRAALAGLLMATLTYSARREVGSVRLLAVDAQGAETVCTGTPIDAGSVLTAAHCVVGRERVFCGEAQATKYRRAASRDVAIVTCEGRFARWLIFAEAEPAGGEVLRVKDGRAATLVSVSDQVVVARSTDSLCWGDSGRALLRGDRIVGVLSRGDRMCRGTDFFARTDRLEWEAPVDLPVGAPMARR